MAIDGQGRVYIPYFEDGVIRRLDPDDSLRVVVCCVSAHGIALAADGTMYLAGASFNRVWRYPPGGPFIVVAGTGVAGFSGDGGPATEAKLNNPEAVAVGPDGSVYIAEWGNHRIRRVAPDGIISTFAGNGNSGPDGADNVPATQSSVPNPTAVAVAEDGTVYFKSYVWLRRVTPNGIIKTVAGVGGTSGTPAYRTSLYNGPAGLAFAPNGDLIIATKPRVYRMTPAGDMTALAGQTIPICCNQDSWHDGGLPLQAAFRNAVGVVMAPDGTYYVSDPDQHHVRRVRPMLPGVTTTDLFVADEGGGEVYQVDYTGRHKFTLDAMSGDTLLTFAYDAAGRLGSVKDGSGNTTTVQRDGVGVPTAIVGPFGQQTGLTLDGNGFLRQVSDPAGNRTRLYHGAAGLLDSLFDARGKKHAFGYDGAGRLVEDDNPAGGSQVLARTDADTGFTVTRSTVMGRQTAYRLDQLENQDQRQEITDPAGFKTVTLRRRDGTTVTTSADGTVTTVSDGSDPRFGPQAPFASRAVVRLPSGDSSVVTSVQQAVVGSALNPFSITSSTDTTFVAGQMFLTTGARSGATWLETSTSPLGRQSFVRTDSLGRLLMARTTGLDSVAYHYDAQGRLDRAQTGGRVATYTYDAQGRVKTTTDPLGRTDSLFYDTADRLNRTKSWDGREIAFAYDSSGNLTSLTPPSRPAHTFGYTPIDLVGSENPPSVGAGTWSRSYTFNADRQVTRILRPSGDSLTFSYDAPGRPSAVSFSRGTFGTDSLRFGYSSTTGALTSIAAPGGSTLGFAYDGALPKQATWTGTVAGSVALGYDAAFRVDTITVNGSPVRFGYDADGLLTSAGALALGRRADNGLLQSDTLGVTGGSWTFDTKGSLAAYTARAGGSILYSAHYVRDSLGRVTEATDTVQGLALTRAFTYDSAGRLQDAREGGTLVRSYGYDPNGNRISLTGPGLSVSGGYDNQDRLLTYGTGSYSYDRNGSLTEKVVGSDTTRYVYDALGNLLKVTLPNGTLVEYLVDGQNRRIGKKVNGTLQQAWLWQSQLAPAAELGASGAIVSRFVYATSVNAPDYMVKDGVTYRLVLDHLGSVRLVVNTADGSVVQRLDYDEFGRVTQNTSPGFQPFGYAGGMYDEQTELVRFGLRDYDAATGRWTARDPLGFGGGDSNLYLYVGNDPARLVDPTGAFSPTIATGLLGATFAAIQAYRSGSDARTIAIAAAGGFLSGLIPGFGFSRVVGNLLAQQLLRGASAGFLGNLAGQLAATTTCPARLELRPALYSAASGAFGNLFSAALPFGAAEELPGALLSPLLSGITDMFTQPAAPPRLVPAPAGPPIPHP
ncbi:MAG TPA: RHS repeat-associated core domain-containing protein [Gemmatimonadales bacterium]|jgi:RHS repeat-associated protein|nr:RHS repeat-associated core domain-containing protein [Gemmatimonadales bacterium]